MPNLTPVKAWRIESLLEEPTWVSDSVRVYGDLGILVDSESKTYEDIIPLRPSVKTLPSKVVFVADHSGLMYLVTADMLVLYNLTCH